MFEATVVFVVMGLGLLISFGGFYLFAATKFKLLRKRVSPLNRDLLRPAGYSLLEKLQELWSEVVLNIAFALAFPGYLGVFVAVAFLTDQSYVSILLTSVGAMCVALYYLWRIRELLTRLNHLTHASQAEMFVAEELNLLLLHGFRVFHDVPIRYGNIDHVVVGASGVFAVNTKAYGRLSDTADQAKLLVDSKNNLLRMPDRNIPIPIEKLRLEARTLKAFLEDATAQKVEVNSVLALPGWYVVGDGGYPIDCRVINPRNSSGFFNSFKHKMSPEEIDRLVYQLDRVCRNIEPIQKRKVTL